MMLDRDSRPSPWHPEDTEPPFPVRGVPGGWRDWWDGPDDSAALRAMAQETDLQIALAVQRERVILQVEMIAQRQQIKS